MEPYIWKCQRPGAPHAHAGPCWKNNSLRGTQSPMAEGKSMTLLLCVVADDEQRSLEFTYDQHMEFDFFTNAKGIFGLAFFCK